tara:strand:- start:2975 stop:3091 length:117 start_codon:yes stop_codon:yes gene_type:complete
MVTGTSTNTNGKNEKERGEREEMQSNIEYLELIIEETY